MLNNFNGIQYRLTDNWFSNVNLDEYKNKAINYLEILPLLVHKVQSMQLEIDELKAIINNNKQ